MKLSKARQAILAKISNKTAREELKQSWAKEAEARNVKYQEFRASLTSKPLQHGVTKQGNGVFIANGGTRYGLIVMTPERARQFVAEFAQFQAAVNSLPESSEE